MAKIPSNTQEEVCDASDDELMSLQGDSDDDNSKRFIVFNAKRDLEDPKFEFTLSMIFSSSKEFKWAAEGSAVMMKKDIKFKKNESSRARAICKVLNCKWFIYASKANEDEPFMIKTIGPDHSCGNQRENKTIDSEFSTKKYADEFKINPSWGVKEFQAHVMRKHSCTLSRYQSYRAKKKALNLITGTKKEQFDMLWDYCAELRRSNPGTTWFDGCHLKGCQKGGQLLIAVGIDANNNMNPVAFAIVEGELKETWGCVLLPARDQHILTIRQSIRIYMMLRLQKNRDKMINHSHIICPRILLKLEKNKDKVAECIAIKSDAFHYQIKDIHLGLFSVDLMERTCSSIWIKKDEPEKYVHECYTVEQYMKSYYPSILPINSSKQWSKTGVEPPLPPIYKAQPGRPRKLRKRGNDETTQKESDSENGTLLKASRKGKKKCELCGKTGHNSRKCPILIITNQSEVQQQQVHQEVSKEGSSILNNETEPRAQPQIPPRSSAFILEEINEHSREGQGHISFREWENNMSHCQAYRRRSLKRARELEIEHMLRRKMFLKYKPNIST
uniref:Zinc knuckle family protein n=1 Tax=Solanum bulbocastanum TaxID=147425 RepID=Q7XA28_SOLBU|nr:Zinc knuckle family protein [Solanum bulbocastanum]